MENNHMHSVIAFFVVFALSAMLTWLTTPAKPCRCIKVGECLKPKANPKFNEGDIMRGGEYVE